MLRRPPKVISKSACHPERSEGGKMGGAQSKDPVESPKSSRDPSTPSRPAFARDGTPLRMTRAFKRILFSAIAPKLALGCCVVAAGLFAGCETEGGNARQGIHDPIVRHSRRSWKVWPFRKSEEYRPKREPAPNDTGALPESQRWEDQGWDEMEPG